MVIYRRNKSSKQDVNTNTPKTERSETNELLEEIWPLIKSIFLDLVILASIVTLLYTFYVAVSDSTDETENNIEVSTTNKDVSYTVLSEVTVNEENPNVVFSKTGIGTYMYNIYLGDELIAEEIMSSWPAYKCCDTDTTKKFNLLVEVLDRFTGEQCGEYKMALTVEK